MNEDDDIMKVKQALMLMISCVLTLAISSHIIIHRKKYSAINKNKYNY